MLLILLLALLLLWWVQTCLDAVDSACGEKRPDKSGPTKAHVVSALSRWSCCWLPRLIWWVQTCLDAVDAACGEKRPDKSGPTKAQVVSALSRAGSWAPVPI